MIIGLNGLKGSGKDTAGSYLVDKYDFKHASFAAKLKESAASLFDIPVEAWDAGKNDSHATVSIDIVMNHIAQDQIKKSITVREFLQRYGTEAHRDIFGADFWVEQAFKEIDPTENYVFTDARFPNELKRIHDAGGFNIRIIREVDGVVDYHASEADPPPELIDFIVYNDHDIKFLQKEIEFCLDLIEEQLNGSIYETY